MTEWLKSAIGSLLVAWERRESGVAYDLLSPQLRQDPYPIYRELRSKDPVHRMRLVKAWALTRYRGRGGGAAGRQAVLQRRPGLGEDRYR